MPEGDTIHRLAGRLGAALAGRRVLRFVSQHPDVEGTLEGRTIVGVRARGKHLLLDVDDGRSLHTHLRMRGRWHLYGADEAWRLPPSRMSVAILAAAVDEQLAAPPHAPVQHREPLRGRGAASVRSEGAARDSLPRVGAADTSKGADERSSRVVAVGFDLPTARIIRGDATLDALGPDLLDQGFDAAEALARLRGAAALPLGVAVMRQGLVSGIGNVYKSELLFLERRDPFLPVAACDDAALGALLERARALLHRNLGPGPRVTRRRYEGRLWVYRRSGEPCLVCGEIVRMRRQGEDGRSTYFCPACQGAR